MSPWFLLRWSLRDLRRKWVQVAVIALVIAIGTGLSSALGGTAEWRYASNDASFEATGMYDLRVRATEGVDVEQGRLLGVLDGMDGIGPGHRVTSAEERLVVDVQVDASTTEESIRVPGRIVGLDVAAGGPHVTSVWVGGGGGRTVTGSDDGRPVAVLEQKFADHYGLTAGAQVHIGGGGLLDIVGTGLAPEYFFITTEEGGFFAESNFAALFVPLGTAQQVTGRPGRVNDLVLTVSDDTDVDAFRHELQRAFDRSDVGLGATVMTADDEDAYRTLYDDIESDRRFWNVFAVLILLGAAFAAFNLSTRMVEAQRREIGIGMSLGASPAQLAWRPLLVGIEIALAGVVLGVAVGSVAVLLLRPVYGGMLPLPVWEMSFQWRPFAQGAALGFAIPLVATAWPVARSLRMTPVDAIATVHRTPRVGLSRVLRRLPWPRSAFRRMPLGNVLRAPRRTVLTALGIAAAVATLVAVLGMLDSFRATMERNDGLVLADHPDRVVVALDSLADVDGGVVASVAAADSVGAVAPVLRLGGRLETVEGGGAAGFDVVIEAIDLQGPTAGRVWAPVVDGDVTRPGVVIARSAADDLGVSVGDEVVLTHPLGTADGFSTTSSRLPVVGIHPSPFRFTVYLDRAWLSLAGADGLANQLDVLPAPGRTPDDVERELFDLPGVASVVPAATASEVVRESLASFTSIFRVLELFMLVLVLLIAYNAASINADERARERATLFAFGLPIRRVVASEMAEGVFYGVFGTAIGIAVGSGINRWMITSLLRSTMPDMTMDAVLGAGTITTAVVLGVVAVAVAPLLTLRRLRTMDVPGTLRVVE
jgi:putative ABC transport system permease protein